MPRTATVKRLTFPEGRRVLAISDIHGNLPFLKGVLAAAQFLSATFLGDAVAVYRTAVGIIAATLVAASASYCIRWCLEYRR